MSNPFCDSAAIRVGNGVGVGAGAGAGAGVDTCDGFESSLMRLLLFRHCEILTRDVSF